MTSCGVNNIWVKPGPNFDFEQLAEGFNLIEADEEPKVLMLNKLPPEWFNLANFIIQRMESIIGANQVARGNVQGKDFSGAAMALLQSMSIQFNNGLIRAVNRLIEDNGNDVIQLTQDFAKEAKLGLIVGEKNRYMMKNYSAKDIAQIQRCYCRQSNPVKDTTAGKMQLLEKYIEMGAVTSPDQVTEVLETGSLDSVTEGGRNLRLAMDSENEAIIRGEEVPVVFTDNHPQHLLKHAEIFANPDDRKDPALIQRARAHIDEHMFVWRDTPPEVLTALGIPVLPPPMMPGPQGPGLPPGAPPPPGGAPQGGGPEAGPPPPPPLETEVDGPNLPKNPMSGETWDPVTGGLPQ
jgi:hypothetical protein